MDEEIFEVWKSVEGDPQRITRHARAHFSTLEEAFRENPEEFAHKLFDNFPEWKRTEWLRRMENAELKNELIKEMKKFLEGLPEEVIKLFVWAYTDFCYEVYQVWKTIKRETA